MAIGGGDPNITIATCRNTLRAAIVAPPKKRNWVQITLTSFCLGGLSFNIAATASAFLARMLAMPQAQPLAALAGIFLFFWLAAQAIFWVSGVGVLGRLLSGRVLTVREGLDDLYLHRS